MKAGQAGKMDQAIQYISQAIQIRPSESTFHYNLGVALWKQGQLMEAMARFQEALRLRPDYAEAHNNLGVALKDQGQLAEAVAQYQEALRLKPDYADAHYNLGLALQKQGRLAEAMGQYQEALRLKPDYADTHYNLGIALQDQGQLAEAVAQYQEALRLKPDYAEAHYNLGVALKDQGQLAEAVAQFQEALRLKPDYAEAHNSLGMTWLLAGDFEQGWPEFEWRWRIKTMRGWRPSFPQPLWDGLPLSGKTILLWAEQGLGDTLQLIRYAPLVKQQGGTVLLWCPAELGRILQTCAGIDHIVTEGSILPPFDVQVPLMSLPAILKTTLETIPANVPYLFPDPELVRWWGGEVAKGRQGDRETRRQGEGRQGEDRGWRIKDGSEPDREPRSSILHPPSSILHPPSSILPVSLSPCLPVFEREFKIGIVWQGNPRFAQPECRVMDQRRSMARRNSSLWRACRESGFSVCKRDTEQNN